MSTDDQVRLIRTELTPVIDWLDDLTSLVHERLPEPTKDDAPRRCQVRLDGFPCVRLAGHDKEHVAYGRNGRGLVTWLDPEPEPTPEPRTWALPEEPPVGTRVIDRDDCAWGRDHDAWRWLSSKGKLVGIGVGWHYLLYCGGPLREATPDDLARLGIEDPS